MNKIKALIICLLYILLINNAVNSQVKLPALVRDSMILQRDAKVKIWGWATNGEKVTVSFAGKKYRTTTGSDGKWIILLAPMKAGGPFTMNIDASNHITLKDILIGDVWFCSGQSNMVHQMELSGYSGVLNNRLTEWRAIAKKGHELANHTLYHPCTGKRPGREFVTADYDLSNYSIRRISDEIRMTNTLLKAIDGKTKRTFAYPCGDTKIGDSSYINPVKNDFVAARGVKDEMLKIEQIDVYNIGCYAINGQTGQQLIDLVKKAMSTNTLLVFLFHGVGGEHSLNVSLPAHRELLQFLKQNEKDIWIAPMLEVAEFIKNHQAHSK